MTVDHPLSALPPTVLNAIVPKLAGCLPGQVVTTLVSSALSGYQPSGTSALTTATLMLTPAGDTICAACGREQLNH